MSLNLDKAAAVMAAMQECGDNVTIGGTTMRCCRERYHEGMHSSNVGADGYSTHWDRHTVILLSYREEVITYATASYRGHAREGQ